MLIVCLIFEAHSGWICWGRAMVAVLHAKLCWAWGTVWVIVDKPGVWFQGCLYSGRALPESLMVLAWDLLERRAPPGEELKCFLCNKPNTENKKRQWTSHLVNHYSSSVSWQTLLMGVENVIHGVSFRFSSSDAEFTINCFTSWQLSSKIVWLPCTVIHGHQKVKLDIFLLLL